MKEGKERKEKKRKEYEILFGDNKGGIGHDGVGRARGRVEGEVMGSGNALTNPFLSVG